MLQETAANHGRGCVYDFNGKLRPRPDTVGVGA